MASLIRAVIVGLAVLAAMVLVLVGIREVRAGRGRHGLFITTLLAALSIAGCGDHRKVRSAADTPEAKPDPVPASIAPQESGRLADLARTIQWAEFKALWKKLDEVEPTKKEEEFIGEYYGSITHEEATAFRDELARVIGELGKPGVKRLVGAVELEILETIAGRRINYLEYGLQSMMTRMMPPPWMTDMDHSIRDLERHIDVLVELRERGKMTSDEFDAALAIVEDDIKTFSILDVLSKNAWGYSAIPLYAILEKRTESGFSVSAAEALIEAFDKEYAEFIEKSAQKQGGDAEKEIAALYEKAKEAIDEIKPVLPFLAELVSDLET